MKGLRHCKSAIAVTTTVFVSCGHHNKLPHTGWLKTIEVDSLTVLEGGSLKPSCQQGWFLLEALKESPSMPLPASGGGQQSSMFLGL